MIFQTPPVVTPVNGPNGQEAFVFSFNFDNDAPKIFTETKDYPESSMDFMAAVSTDLSPFKMRGGKLNGGGSVPVPASMSMPPAKRALAAVGFGALVPSLKRSPYDEFMMNFHNYLKENSGFQQKCPKQHWEFPPGSSWMVYTDMVSHAVLSGQFALEQTLIVAKDAMVVPEKSPYAVLSRLATG